MNDQDKAELIKYRLTRARETYKEVGILVKNELWNTAVNRLYYSCFYAVIALLADQDIEVQSHSGARQMLVYILSKLGLSNQNQEDFWHACLTYAKPAIMMTLSISIERR